MNTEIFSLCDYAQQSNGKLTIVGTFDAYNTPNFPSVPLQCAIAGRLRFANSEFGKHAALIKFIDFTGKNVIPELNFDFEVRSTLDYAIFNFVLNIGSVQFKTAGKYAVELYIDGDWLSGLTLNVNSVGIAA